MEFRKFSQNFAAVMGGRGNGALHVVPAVERTMLHTALARVTELEKLLTAARSDAKQAARRASVSISALFDGDYVSRVTADHWYSQGIEQGKDQRAREIIRALEAMRNPNPEFEAIGEALRQAIERGAFDKILGRTGTTSPEEADAADLAQQILAAGERARSSGEHERPEPTGVSAKILDAGRRRRIPMGGENK